MKKCSKLETNTNTKSAKFCYYDPEIQQRFVQVFFPDGFSPVMLGALDDGDQQNQ